MTHDHSLSSTPYFVLIFSSVLYIFQFQFYAVSQLLVYLQYNNTVIKIFQEGSVKQGSH